MREHPKKDKFIFCFLLRERRVGKKKDLVTLIWTMCLKKIFLSYGGFYTFGGETRRRKGQERVRRLIDRK